MPLVIGLPPRCFKRGLAESFRRGYLLPMKMPFRPDRDQMEDRGGPLLRIKKNLQKGIKTLLEALHHHLLVTPPSHQLLQKAKG
jgi:hypothetical protein